MADHARDHLAYWAAVPDRYADALYPLRQWPHLKMATEGGLIWLRDFTREDIESASVRRIPLLQRYYLQDARLYPVGNSLPVMVAPNLLWTDLRRGLKVRLPKENFNYFGVEHTHQLSLVHCAIPREVTATIVELVALGEYLYDAPSVRVAPLQWTILGIEHALILGTPLLPIRGQDYYQQAGFLIPAGWQLRYQTMASVYRDALADSSAYWYLLDENSQLSKVSKADFNHLSKGSFVNTLQP
ncbi:MAG: hypothetical protein AAFZ52_19305 [Bacteroidota bacterium]